MRVLPYISLSILTISLLNAGPCQTEQSESEASSEVDAATSMGDALDDATSVVALQHMFQPNQGASPILEILNPISEATADPCAFTSCVNGSAIQIFNGCTLSRGGTLFGQVSRTYSSGSCGTIGTGQTFTRDFDDLKRVGPRGFFSATNSGNVIVTGVGASQWSIAIDRTRVIRNEKNGRELRSIHVTTLASLVLTGGLQRANRQISSGKLRVENTTKGNISDLTITQTITYSSDCFWPNAGEITIEHVRGDGFHGASRIVFNSSCGHPVLMYDSGGSPGAPVDGIVTLDLDE